MGMVMFTTEPVRNFREWLRIDQTRWQEMLTGMLNVGVLPFAIDNDEQWTVSVQHTEEDIDAFLSAFEKIAPNLTS